MFSIARGSLLLLWVAVVNPAVAQSPSNPPLDPAPLYVESSVVNAASPAAGGLAPNTLATIYGQFLSRVTRAVTPDDIRAGVLPTVLPGTGVRVLVGGILAPLLYISPSQINFVVPANLLPGQTDLRVGIDSRYGPAVRVRLDDSAPALFLRDPEFVIAVRPDGSLASADSPASGGELLVLFATGLGVTEPRTESGQLVRSGAPLRELAQFRIWLDGAELPAANVLYAGLAPGFAGLYQVNFRLPDGIGRNPEIRAGFTNGLGSPPGVRLHVVDKTQEPHAAVHRLP